MQHEDNASMQPCARKGVAISPRRGDALLFYSLQPDGELVHAFAALCWLMHGEVYGLQSKIACGKLMFGRV